MKQLTIVIVATTIVCLSVLPILGAIKERDWQEGKLIDIVSEPHTRGSVFNGTGGMIQGERITYVIDAGKYVYTASHIHFPRDKAMAVTVNVVVKFAIEKSKVYLLDEEDKEHELRFVKRALKQP